MNAYKYEITEKLHFLFVNGYNTTFTTDSVPQR